MRPFAWVSSLGRNTLPIYLLHWYVLLAVYAVVNLVAPTGRVPSPTCSHRS